MTTARDNARRWRRWRYIAWCALLVSLWIAVVAHWAEAVELGLSLSQIRLATYISMPGFALAVVAILVSWIAEKRAEGYAEAEEAAKRDRQARDAAANPRG